MIKNGKNPPPFSLFPLQFLDGSVSVLDHLIHPSSNRAYSYAEVGLYDINDSFFFFSMIWICQKVNLHVSLVNKKSRMIKNGKNPPHEVSDLSGSNYTSYCKSS